MTTKFAVKVTINANINGAKIAFLCSYPPKIAFTITPPSTIPRIGDVATTAAKR